MGTALNMSENVMYSFWCQVVATTLSKSTCPNRSAVRHTQLYRPHRLESKGACQRWRQATWKIRFWLPEVMTIQFYSIVDGTWKTLIRTRVRLPSGLSKRSFWQQVLEKIQKKGSRIARMLRDRALIVLPFVFDHQTLWMIDHSLSFFSYPILWSMIVSELMIGLDKVENPITFLIYKT